jgi:hypothetical protein
MEQAEQVAGMSRRGGLQSDALAELQDAGPNMHAVSNTV